MGEPLALALAVGAGVDDLPTRLLTLATAERVALARQVLRAVRVLAWIAITWASWRAFAGLANLELGGLPGGLNLPGMDGKSGEMEQLMRELDL
ncbi:MAG: hypothetical protein H6702_16265 [Myxococcales bacterium]|nr:hypothetical protein [Myxococcales bacterium]